MTKCTSCRVRHLTCDQNLICTECAKGDRECNRGYNLRFRHLTCPAGKPSRADYSRYEFFFDSGQTWLNPNANVEFVLEDGVLPSFSPGEELARDNETESRTHSAHQATHLDLSHAPSEQPSALINDSRECFDAGDAYRSGSLSKLDILADQSLAEASLIGETLRGESRMSYPQTPAAAIDPPWPLRSLQEGRLLQHFVTHLAPWVCISSVS